MDTLSRPSQCTPGRRTILAVAIASALLAGQSGTTQAATAPPITNTGVITELNNPFDTEISAAKGIENTNTGSIDSLSNDGSISGSSTAIRNDGSIGTLSNSGSITSGHSAIRNDGSIDTLSNSGTISGQSGIGNAGSIGTLSNIGTISGRTSGIFIGSSGSIGTLSNSGTISGDSSGIYNYGSIGTLSNSGTISGGNSGIYIGSSGSIGTLNNDNIGTISGLSTGIYIASSGSLGTLSNSGTISGPDWAINHSFGATPLTISNSGTGTIAGGILSGSASDLTINGGTGPLFGLLTGFSGGTGASDIGQITSLSSNLVFGAGNQLLNDNINVGSNSVFNQGTLKVNNTITITGNYDQAANAKLLIGVGDNAVATGAATDSGYGRLVVSGDATIASGSSVGLVRTHAYGFAQGQRYLAIQASGAGTNYNADTLHYSADGYNVAGTSVVNSGHTDLLLTVGGALPVTPSVTPPSDPINRAATANGASTLAGLFRYQGFDADLMNVFNAAAATGSTAEGNKAGAQLSPASNLAAATQGSTGSTVQVLNVTSAHIAGLRSAPGGVASGIATGEGPATSGLWGQAFGGTSRMDERDDIAGYHARYNGLLIGADGMLNDSWRAGGLFSYTKTTVNNDGDNSGSSADVKSYGLFGYASYTGNPWYLDLSLGAIEHQYDTQREVNFTGVNGNAEGSHDGMQYTAAAQAGYPIDLGASMANVILTPIAGLNYSTLQQDSYSEHGGAGAALHVSADNLNSLKSDLGTKLERSFATSYGNLVPSAQLTWRHEFRDAGLQSVANFTADTAGATSFSSTGPKAVEDTGVLTLGLALVTHNDLTVSAHYTGEAGGGFTANTGDVQVRWAF